MNHKHENRKYKYRLYPTSAQESTRFGYYEHETVLENEIVERQLANGATIVTTLPDKIGELPRLRTPHWATLAPGRPVQADLTNYNTKAERSQALFPTQLKQGVPWRKFYMEVVTKKSLRKRYVPG